jgi:RNA polymerase sigma-70 factor, ECF subfamily
VASPAGQPPDHELLHRLAAGDDAALAALYDRHAAIVYGTALHLVADVDRAADVTEAVFVELWTRAHRYAAAAGPLPGILRRLTHHHAVSVVRASQGGVTPTLASLPDPGRLP